MENETSFLSNLQTAYTEAFVNGDSNAITPEIVTIAIILAVAAGVFYEKVVEPKWVKRQLMKTNTFPEQSQFTWLRLGAGAVLFLCTAFFLLVLHWPR